MGIATQAPMKLVTGFYEIELDRLHPHPRNIRKHLGDLEELSASIALKGVLEPLLVAIDGAVVCGNRRLAAAGMAMKAKVPCVVSEIGEAEAVELMLHENLQRNDLTPVEEAGAYQQLIDFGQTAEEISDNVNINADRIRRRVALLQLPLSARSLLESHRITLGAAEELLVLKAHPDEIDRLIDRAGFGTDVAESNRTPTASFGWQLTEAKNRVKEIEDREAAKAKIEKEGLKVVAMPDLYSTKKTGPKRVGSGYGELNTPIAAHRKLDCHAVAIASNGELIPVCTKPKNHPEAAEKPDAAAHTSEQYKAEADAREEARDRRKAVLRRYYEAHPMGSAEVDALAVLARNRYGEVLDNEVCDLAGVNHDDDRLGTKSFTNWLLEGATAISGSMPVPTTARLAEARLAIDLAFLDSCFEDSDDIATPWLLFLRANGYEPTESELELFNDDVVMSWAKNPMSAFE